MIPQYGHGARTTVAQHQRSRLPSSASSHRAEGQKQKSQKQMIPPQGSSDHAPGSNYHDGGEADCLMIRVDPQPSMLVNATPSQSFEAQRGQTENHTMQKQASKQSSGMVEVLGEQAEDDQPEVMLEEAETPSVFGTRPLGTIGKSKPRAVVRIERDFSARGATSGRVQFWDGWIEELDGRITPLQLQNALNDLNSILASAYDPYKSILDNTLAILTFYISPLLIPTHYERQMKLFNDTLERINSTIFNPVGLRLLNPRKVAFLFLEIEYY